MGAAAGLLLAEGAGVVLMQRAVRQSMTIAAPERLGGIVMASIVLSVILPFIDSMHVLLTVVIGAVTYVAAAVLTRALTLSDIRELRQRDA